jgi:hypothetical protein
MTARRLLIPGMWLGATALVVLAARSIAYALAPSNSLLLEQRSLRTGLQHSAGGPRLVVVALVALGLTIGLAAVFVWLASVGVRERAALAPGPLEPPRFRLLRVAGHALALTLVTCGAFSALESYLHLRAGLPWHGFGCLAGPVHVGAMPILAGLSVLAAAAIDAAGHVLRWMRRTIRLLLERPPRLDRPAALLSPIVDLIAPPKVRLLAARPRPPPLLAG